MDSNDLEKERGITILAKIPPLNGMIIELILLIPRAMLILVVKLNGLCQWLIVCCYWLMRWMARCHKPASLRKSFCPRFKTDCGGQ